MISSLKATVAAMIKLNGAQVHKAEFEKKKGLEMVSLVLLGCSLVYAAKKMNL